MWFIAMGNIGLNRMPIMETETIDAIKEGTSQSINWKLFFFYESYYLKKMST